MRVVNVGGGNVRGQLIIMDIFFRLRPLLVRVLYITFSHFISDEKFSVAPGSFLLSAKKFSINPRGFVRVYVVGRFHKEFEFVVSYDHNPVIIHRVKLVKRRDIHALGYVPKARKQRYEQKHRDNHRDTARADRISVRFLELLFFLLKLTRLVGVGFVKLLDIRLDFFENPRIILALFAHKKIKRGKQKFE
jgi:hypothetical protein